MHWDSAGCKPRQRDAVARPPDRPLLAARQVRRRPCRRRSAHQRRSRRSGQLRGVRAHRRRRALRARPGVKFETFAAPRIRGAIFDGLRQLDWVPRSVRSRAREVERGVHRARGRTGGRRPTKNWRPTSGSAATELEKWLASIASTTVGPLDRALVAGTSRRRSVGDGPESPSARRRGRRGARLVRGEVKRFPIGRSSCCRCTTTRV